nr:hypothetical protein [Escherichia coli]
MRQQQDELGRFSICSRQAAGVPEGARNSRFDQLRKGPVAISGPAFNQAVARYLKLKAYGMQPIDFIGIPPVCFNTLAQYADIISVYKIARMSPARRTAMLVAFVRSRIGN